MSVQDIDTLKSYFETWDKPTESEFWDLIDSTANEVIENKKWQSDWFAWLDTDWLVPRSNLPTRPSSKITVNTSNFNKNLSDSDDTVQKALETLDQLEWWSWEDGWIYIKNDIYSTDEVKTNKYYLGKPVYRKIVILDWPLENKTTTTTWIYFDTLENVSMMIGYDYTSNDDAVRWLSLQCWINNNKELQYYFDSNADDAKWEIIIEYTKTTDDIKTDLNTNLQLVQWELSEYSTDEVLTERRWIDWKPIYRKTIDFWALPNNDTKDVPHNIPDFDTYKQTVWLEIIWWRDWYIYCYNWEEHSRLIATDTDVRVVTTTDMSSHNAYIIIEYTKTTDDENSPVANLSIPVEWKVMFKARTENDDEDWEDSISFTDPIIDTHNWASNGKYIIPVSWYYHIDIRVTGTSWDWHQYWVKMWDEWLIWLYTNWIMWDGDRITMTWGDIFEFQKWDEIYVHTKDWTFWGWYFSLFKI